MQDVEVLKLLSVTLSREKQDILQEELRKYGAATNWTIKQILKQTFVSNLAIIKYFAELFQIIENTAFLTV